MALIKDKIKGKERQEYAYKYYISMGWTPEQSSAIVGNLLRESGLDTGIEGDKGYKGGSSFGLAQWRGDRLTKLKSMYGDKWQDFDNQLAFVDYELNNTEKEAGDKLRKSKSVWEAGKTFTDEYERPKVKFYADDQRQQHVADTYRKFSKSQLTEEDKKMFSVYNTQVKPYITTDVTNFDTSIESSNFAGVPDVYQEPKEEVKQAQEELTQQQNEKNFLQELYQQQTEEAPQEVQQEEIAALPQSNLLDTFSQVSQFIDQPIAQSGGRYKIKDERAGILAVKDEIPRNEDKSKLLNEFILEQKDKEELQSTGKIKNPRSIHYQDAAQKLKDKQTTVSQDNLTPKQREEYSNAMEKVHNEPLGVGDRPLIYLANPGKILGDIGIKGMPTSEEDRQKINLNRYNPVQSGREQFKNNLEMGLGYVPKATANLALGAAFAPESAGMRGILNETLNPLAGVESRGFKYNPLFNKLPQELNPNLLNARDGEQWIKDWYNHPETKIKASAYERVTPEGELKSLTGSNKIDMAISDINEYKDKNYLDLLKDKGLGEYINKNLTSTGVSYGVPDEIYTKSQLRFGFNKVGRESTKVHEITHLAERNGRRFNDKETDALLEPFGYNTQEIFGTDKTPLQVLGNRDKTYHVDPTEIHARMNEARYNLGLKPDDIFTENDYNTIQNGTDWFGMGKYIKDKGSFVKLMNNFYTAAPVAGAGYIATQQPEVKQEGGAIPTSSQGVYQYPGQEVLVPTKDGRITMSGVNYPIKGTDEFGNTQIMKPGGEYQFVGKTIKEEPQLTDKEKAFLKAIQQYKNKA